MHSAWSATTKENLRSLAQMKKDQFLQCDKGKLKISNDSHEVNANPQNIQKEIYRCFHEAIEVLCQEYVCAGESSLELLDICMRGSNLDQAARKIQTCNPAGTLEGEYGERVYQDLQEFFDLQEKVITAASRVEISPKITDTKEGEPGSKEPGSAFVTPRRNASEKEIKTPSAGSSAGSSAEIRYAAEREREAFSEISQVQEDVDSLCISEESEISAVFPCLKVDLSQESQEVCNQLYQLSAILQDAKQDSLQLFFNEGKFCSQRAQSRQDPDPKKYDLNTQASIRLSEIFSSLIELSPQELADSNIRLFFAMQDGGLVEQAVLRLQGCKEISPMILQAVLDQVHDCSCSIQVERMNRDSGAFKVTAPNGKAYIVKPASFEPAGAHSRHLRTRSGIKAGEGVIREFLACEIQKKMCIDFGVPDTFISKLKNSSFGAEIELCAVSEFISDTVEMGELPDELIESLPPEEFAKLLLQPLMIASDGHLGNVLYCPKDKKLYLIDMGLSLTKPKETAGENMAEGARQARFEWVGYRAAQTLIPGSLYPNYERGEEVFSSRNDTMAGRIQAVNVEELVTQLKEVCDEQAQVFGKKCVIDQTCWDSLRVSMLGIQAAVRCGATLLDYTTFFQPFLFKDPKEGEEYWYGGEFAQFWEAGLINDGSDGDFSTPWDKMRAMVELCLNLHASKRKVKGTALERFYGNIMGMY